MPDLLGFFQQISFPLCLTLCVSMPFPLGRIPARVGCYRAATWCLPMHIPAVNSDEHSGITLRSGNENVFLTSSNVRGKEPGFDERAPCLGCCSASSPTGCLSPMKTFLTGTSHLST